MENKAYGIEHNGLITFNFKLNEVGFALFGDFCQSNGLNHNVNEDLSMSNDSTDLIRTHPVKKFFVYSFKSFVSHLRLRWRVNLTNVDIGWFMN